MRKLAMLAAGGVLILTAGIAFTQTKETGKMTGMDHSSMNMPAAMKGYMGAMDTMMKAMPKKSTGDADADFLTMMIPHHQSAIDMARIELEEGDDEATLAMAQKVIDAQEAEISQMQEMLAGME